MADTSMMINPWALGNNPYVFGMANFANQYSATDTESLYNTSIFNPMMAGYGMCDPSLMGMMGMYGGMMGGMGMMNPMYMMQRTLNPAAYDAMSRGINPMGSLYFKNNSQFQNNNDYASTMGKGIDSLALYAHSDNQDDFKAVYNKLVVTEKARLKSLGSSLNDAQLTSTAKAHINEAFQAKYKVPLAQALAMKGDDPFTQGMKDVVTIGPLFGDKETVSQNIANVNDAPLDSSQRRREQRVQCLGRVSAAGLGAGVVFGTVGAGIRQAQISGAVKNAIDVADGTLTDGEVFNNVPKAVKDAIANAKSGKTGTEATEAAIKAAKESGLKLAKQSVGSRLKGFGKWGLIAALIAGAVTLTINCLKD